jgi:transposase
LRHVAVADGPEGRISAPLAFANDYKGFVTLTMWITELQQRWKVRHVVIGLEPTGHYWKPLAEWLARRDYALQLVAPRHTYQAKELEDGSPLKSDAKDARVIADLVRQGRGRAWTLQDPVFVDLRHLVEVRKRPTKERTALLHRQTRLLDLMFPELLKLFTKKHGLGLQALLRVAPTPEAVLALGVEGVAEVLKTATRGHLGLARAKAVVEAAVFSVGCRHGRAAYEFDLQGLLPRLAELIKRQERIERELEARLAEVEYAELLLSIPGLGPVTVAVILGELGDLRRYRVARQVLKMAGLNLYEKSSGQHQGQLRIAKRGRSYLRQILFLAAIRMFKQGRPLAGLRQKHGPAKPGAKLVVAGMRRLLRAMFAMVHGGQVFNQALFEVRPTMEVRAKQIA